MAEHQTNRKALHKEISSIFAGVCITKKTSSQQPGVPASTHTGSTGRKSPTAAQMICLQPMLQPQDKPQPKTIVAEESVIAPSTNVPKPDRSHMRLPKSRRERKRLRSISKHLLINLQSQS
jgi:hypothetical protein